MEKADRWARRKAKHREDQNHDRRGWVGGNPRYSGAKGWVGNRFVGNRYLDRKTTLWEIDNS